MPSFHVSLFNLQKLDTRSPKDAPLYDFTNPRLIRQLRVEVCALEIRLLMTRPDRIQAGAASRNESPRVVVH